jgi:hypothetical protein
VPGAQAGESDRGGGEPEVTRWFVGAAPGEAQAVGGQETARRETGGRQRSEAALGVFIECVV